MKRGLITLSVAVMTVFSMLVAAPMATAQNNKMLQKEQKKEYKKKIKQLNKEGWEITGSHTLEVALLTHYDKLAKGDVEEIEGTAKAVNERLARQAVIAAAQNQYAQLAGGRVRGRVVEDMGSNLTESDQKEFDNFYAAYENAVEKEIKGEMKLSYLLKRKAGNAYEYRGVFIIDEAAASAARIRAFELAAKESEIAQRYAKKVSEFINEAFDD